MKKYIPLLLAILSLVLCESPICENTRPTKLSNGIHINIKNYNNTISSNQLGLLYLFEDTVFQQAIKDTSYSMGTYQNIGFNPYSLSRYIGANLSIGLRVSSTVATDTFFLDTFVCEDSAYAISVYIDSFPYQSQHKELIFNYNNKALTIYYDKYLF
jgi:hypothetical protein